MRLFKTFLICAVFLGLLVSPGEAGTAKILKTLPHHLDKQGRHTLAPSLYERDAYQAHLRKNHELIAGLRFDVQWKARQVNKDSLKLRVEIRAGKTPLDKPFVIEQAVQPKGWFSTWTGLTIDGETFQKLGKIIAWRVSLWEDGQLLAEQRSFLWQDTPGGVTETKR